MTLVYLPDQHRMQRDHAAAWESSRHGQDPLQRHCDCREMDLPVLDIGAVFSTDPEPGAVWWRPRTHYSPYGNMVLGKAVVEYLVQKEVPSVK